MSNYIIGGRERAKHIDLRKHCAHQAVQDRQIRLYKRTYSPSRSWSAFYSCVYGLLKLDADGFPT